MKLALGAVAVGGGYYAWKKFKEETWPEPEGTIIIGGEAYSTHSEGEAEAMELDSEPLAK